MTRAEELDIPAARDEDPFATEKALERRYGLGKGSIRRMMAYEDFPQPVKLGPRWNRWRMSEVLDWEAGRGRTELAVLSAPRGSSGGEAA